MFTIVLILGAAWLGFKKAKLAGRNPYKWALICLGAFIAPQVLGGLILGTVAFFKARVLDVGRSSTLAYVSILDIISLIAGFIALLFAYRYLDTIQVGEAVFAPPPPPPSFDDANEHLDE